MQDVLVWLYWRQIDTNNFGLGMCIGWTQSANRISGGQRRDNTKIYGPDTCTAASIKSSIHVLDGCEIEFLVQCEPYDVMLEVCRD
jgi:hypothetical protein